MVGINYAPEPVGIGPYTAEMAAGLSAAGFDVEIIAARPYYPTWRASEGFSSWRYRSSVEDGVRVTRCPIYVPGRPTGARRVLHHLSFAAGIVPPLLNAIVRRPPQLLLVVAPSMISAPVGRFFGRLSRAKTWLHVQDFEVGAAMATGLIASRGPRAALARSFETFAYAGFDRASSISPQMCARLSGLGLAPERVVEFRNWTTLQQIQPMRPSDSVLSAEWNPEARHVALYSGNISNKQGLECVIDAAQLLAHRRDILFVICGDGPQKPLLMKRAQGLANLVFHDLQPREHLNEVLGLAALHLLPQIASAADLVLPSKLANMFASGKPVVATAEAGTGIAREVDGCGVVVRPADPRALATAVEGLIDDPSARAWMGRAARARAIERWSKEAMLQGLVAQIDQLIPASMAGAGRVHAAPPAPARARISATGLALD